jgi:hypothetical protein
MAEEEKEERKGIRIKRKPQIKHHKSNIDNLINNRKRKS